MPTPLRKIVLVLLFSAAVSLLIARFFFHNQNALPWLFLILWIVSSVALIWGLIAPLHFSSKMMPDGKEMSRKGVITVFGLLGILFFILIGVTAPANAESITIKTLTETKPVHYSTTVQYDDRLPKGQTQVIKEGVDGVETSLYTVTYSNGKEIARVLKTKSVTAQPVPKVDAVGTYVAPAQSIQTPTASGTGYTNVDGNHINSPSSDPAGASAQCADGTYSYSAHRQGTCSHHGGVARWL